MTPPSRSSDVALLRIIAEGGFPLFDDEGQLDEEEAIEALGLDKQLVRDLTAWSDESQLVDSGTRFADWPQRGEALRARVAAAAGANYLVELRV